MSAPRIILIAGPTASGKSALAIALAERFAGTVVNADSMQVYRELRVVTARPSRAEEARVPHRLFGTVPGTTAYSTGQWLAAATQEIGAALAAGRSAIVVGGTGLYFKALTEGLAPIPGIPVEIRSRWRRLAAEQSPVELYALLRLRDPATASRLQPTDPQRIVRALEVHEATGRPLCEWQRSAEAAADPRIEAAVRIALRPDRSWLAASIAARAPRMLTDAAIAEVRDLLSLGLDPEVPAMKAIGVKEIGAMLDGHIDRVEAQDRIVRATSRYAKRQATWARSQMAAWMAVDPGEPDLVDRAASLCNRPT
jgi:tRNA dimethylallyltransferase